MAWILLVLAGGMEAVWATALGASDNLRRRRATVVVALGLLASFSSLTYAMTHIPVGTAYAVWGGIGTALTVLVAVALKHERLSVARAALLVLLVGCVVGLKAVS